jgi:hypothetical protein
MPSHPTSEQRSPCMCGHVAQEHYDGHGLATCRIEDCDCEWYVADEREESAEQYP